MLPGLLLGSVPLIVDALEDLSCLSLTRALDLVMVLVAQAGDPED